MDSHKRPSRLGLLMISQRRGVRLGGLLDPHLRSKHPSISTPVCGDQLPSSTHAPINSTLPILPPASLGCSLVHHVRLRSNRDFALPLASNVGWEDICLCAPRKVQTQQRGRQRGSQIDEQDLRSLSLRTLGKDEGSRPRVFS